MILTTKPSGEGTGLGLSINYNIIKTISVEIIMDTKANAFTEFSIMLPV